MFFTLLETFELQGCTVAQNGFRLLTASYREIKHHLWKCCLHYHLFFCLWNMLSQFTLKYWTFTQIILFFFLYVSRKKISFVLLLIEYLYCVKVKQLLLEKINYFSYPNWQLLNALLDTLQKKKSKKTQTTNLPLPWMGKWIAQWFECWCLSWGGCQFTTQVA